MNLRRRTDDITVFNVQMKEYRLTDWLPTPRKKWTRGWDELDVCFSAVTPTWITLLWSAVIRRILENPEGLRVAIIPNPTGATTCATSKNWDVPVCSSASVPAVWIRWSGKYTANKRLRSDDAYTPDASDMRPEYPSIVYTQILKKLFPDVPVVLGGIEASMRRLTHYDYWQDRVRPASSSTAEPTHSSTVWERNRWWNLRKAETPTDTDGRPKLQKAHRRYSQKNGLP